MPSAITSRILGKVGRYSLGETRSLSALCPPTSDRGSSPGCDRPTAFPGAAATSGWPAIVGRTPA
jgi:hypothetical protein